MDFKQFTVYAHDGSRSLRVTCLKLANGRIQLSIETPERTPLALMVFEPKQWRMFQQYVGLGVVKSKHAPNEVCDCRVPGHLVGKPYHCAALRED